MHVLTYYIHKSICVERASFRIGFQVKRFNKVEHLSINRNCLSYYFYRLRFVYIAQDASLFSQPAARYIYIYIHIYFWATDMCLCVVQKSGKATLDISHRLVIAIIFFQLSGSGGWSPKSFCGFQFSWFRLNFPTSLISWAVEFAV